MRVVITAVCELVYMRSIHDAACIHGDATVASQRAGIVVCRHDGQAKAGFASALARLGVEFRIGFHDVVWWNRETNQVVESGALARVGEVLGYEQAPELLAESGIMQADMKIGIELCADHSATLGGGVASIVERRPTTVAVQVKERQSDVRPL